jgi:hypothetical protein
MTALTGWLDFIKERMEYLTRFNLVGYRLADPVKLFLSGHFLVNSVACRKTV